MTEQTDEMRQQLANLEGDEANLQQKIDKKRAELDRHQKRLSSLQTVRASPMRAPCISLLSASSHTPP